MPNRHSYCWTLETQTTNFSYQLQIIHIVKFGPQFKNIYVYTPWLKTTKQEKGVRSGLVQKACFIQQCRFLHTIKWREHFCHIKERWRSFLQSEAHFSSRLVLGIQTSSALLFSYCRHKPAAAHNTMRLLQDKSHYLFHMAQFNLFSLHCFIKYSPYWKAFQILVKVVDLNEISISHTHIFGVMSCFQKSIELHLPDKCYCRWTIPVSITSV